MDSWRQVGSGLLFGLVCLFVVIGGFSLSMTEGGMSAATPTLPFTFTPPVIVVPTLPVIPSFTAAIPASDTPLPLPSATFTAPPPPIACPPPTGWFPVIIQPSDSLASLSQTYRISSDSIRQANCLMSDQLVTGSYLYLPPLPYILPTVCGAPYGWVNYFVQPGDTLYSIGLLYRVSVTDLQRANCMGSTTYLQAGKLLKVPNRVTSTPWATFAPTATYIIIQQPTATLTPVDTLPPTDTAAPPTATQATPTMPVPPTDTQPPPTSTSAPTNTLAPSPTPQLSVTSTP